MRPGTFLSLSSSVELDSMDLYQELTLLEALACPVHLLATFKDEEGIDIVRRAFSIHQKVR